MLKFTYGDMNCLRAAKNARDAGMAWKPGTAFVGSAKKLLTAGLVVKLDTGGFEITELGIRTHATLPKTKAERAAIARRLATVLDRLVEKQ